MMATKAMTLVFLTSFLPAAHAQDVSQNNTKGTEQQIRDNIINADRNAARQSLAPIPFPTKIPVFLAAAADYPVAVQAYRLALESRASLKEPLVRLKKAFDGFKAYLEPLHLRGGKLDKSEFKKLSRDEMAAELLKSAVRMEPDLRRTAVTIENLVATPHELLAAGPLFRDVELQILRMELLVSKLR
jgi:hypothetical protein